MSAPPTHPLDAHAAPFEPAGPVQDEVLEERSGRRLRRLGARSLTSRLVTFVVALIIVLVAVFGAATYLLLKPFLVDQLDTQLSPVTASNANNLERCMRFNIETCAVGDGRGGYRAPATEWLRIFGPNLESPFGVDASATLKPLNLTSGQLKSIFEDPTAVRTLTTRDGIELRVSARAIQAPGGTYVVASGLSTRELHRTMAKLVAIELSIGGAAVLLAFLATSYGVRYSLRGLRRVTTTAQDVAYELSPEGRGLERRVPVTEEGTEVGQLAESMNTLLGAVETQFAARLESEHRMRQFLADASHELRTPLTSIRGYAELARMQRAVGEGVDDNLSRIESEGTRMSRLVEDLLTLARGDATEDGERRAKTELIDVDDLLDDVVSGSRAAFPERRIDLDVAGDAHLLGDRDQLVRVVRNLVSNAAMHTAPERPIRVRSHEEGDEVVIEVVDGGPGLAPDEAAHVFERFWRADKARTRARGGSGLGLSIVAAMVHAHGGTVRFDSSVDHGSTVTVRLPAVRST